LSFLGMKKRHFFLEFKPVRIRFFVSTTRAVRILFKIYGLDNPYFRLNQ